VGGLAGELRALLADAALRRRFAPLLDGGLAVGVREVLPPLLRLL
jgi:hypothetical protein